MKNMQENTDVHMKGHRYGRSSDTMIWGAIAVMFLLVIGGLGFLAISSKGTAASPGSGVGTPASTGTGGNIIVNTPSANLTPIGQYYSYSTGNTTQVAYNSTTYQDGLVAPISSALATPATGTGAGFAIGRGTSGTVYIGNGGNASGDAYIASVPYTVSQTNAANPYLQPLPIVTVELAAKPQGISFSNGSTATATTLLSSNPPNNIVAGQNGPTNAILYLQGSTGFWGRNAHEICAVFNSTNITKVWFVPTGAYANLVSVTTNPTVDNAVTSNSQFTAAANQNTQCYEATTQPSAAGIAQAAALGLPAGETVGLPPGITEAFQVNMIAGVTPVSSSIDIALNDKTDSFSNVGTASGSHLINSYVDPNGNDLGKAVIYIDQAIVVN